MILGGLVLAFGMFSCDDQDGMIRSGAVITSDFERDSEDWTGALAEYGKATDTSTIEFRFSRAALPAPLDTKKNGLMLQSHNRSDDMFMFLKKKVTGLKANQTYNVVFEIDLGTNARINGIGAGGSPGSSVYLKAGASPNEPVAKLENDFYTFNLDKGAQSEGGKELFVLGNIENGIEQDEYKIIKRDNVTKPVEVKANTNGEIWLCIGTDSGYEGLTVLYYDKIKTTITEKVMN